MKQRQLGRKGPKVSALGFGLMSLSSTYGRSDDEESIRTIHHALDLGINFLDTAEAYGVGHNEQLVSKVLAERRDEVFLATKFGIHFADGRMRANGKADNVRRASMEAYNVSASSTSTSTTCTVVIRRRPSKIRSVPWRSW
jgi:aryl-alcohol dehydrogenase-like predicted oxidoreductase